MYTWVGYRLPPLGKCPRRTCNLYANSGNSKLSFILGHCFKNQIHFPLSHCLLSIPKSSICGGCGGQGGKAYLIISAPQKRSVFFILFNSIGSVLPGKKKNQTNIYCFLRSQFWMCYTKVLFRTTIFSFFEEVGNKYKSKFYIGQHTYFLIWDLSSL